MYARVTTLEIDTLRVDMHEAVALFHERVLPELREQPGYEGVTVLTAPAGQALLVTLWATPEAAEPNGFYLAQLSEFATLFRAPPGRERYEVAFSETPVLLPGLGAS
jgi:hypothetical protein